MLRISSKEEKDTMIRVSVMTQHDTEAQVELDDVREGEGGSRQEDDESFDHERPRNAWYHQ